MERRLATLDDITLLTEDSTLSLTYDDGIAYGLGFFETIHVSNRCIFLQAHISRLNTSLKIFDFPFKISCELIDQLVKENNLYNRALKIHVTPSKIIVSTRAITYDRDYYKKGLTLSLSPIIRSSDSFLVKHKSSNYGDLILSLRQAHKNGYNDCVFFNEKGFITETCVANIFVIKDNTLFTPSLSCGLLPGIIREYIKDSYTVVEAPLTIDDLVFADGIFLSNSLVGMVKVSHIDFDPSIILAHRFIQMEDFIKPMMDYKEHPLYTKIRNTYNDLIT